MILRAASYATLAPEDAAASQPAAEDSDKTPLGRHTATDRFREQRPIARNLRRKFRKAYLKDELRKQEKKLRRRIHQKKKLIGKKERAIQRNRALSMLEMAALTAD